MKTQIFIMEDNEFYFEIIKEVLENMSLTFYPNSKDNFYQLRRLLCTCTDENCLGSFIKKSKDKIWKILKDYKDEGTIFLVTCCLGESQDPTLEGLTLYKEFTKNCGGKTIIMSSTTLSREIETIENFCKKEPNCFFFRKSKKSLQKSFGEFLVKVCSGIVD